ncbi:MAG: hypothetical protein AAGB93_21075 [Planctomycetota bacterium]
MADTPHIGGWLLLLVALGPPTVLGLAALAIDALWLWATGSSWGVVATEAPFLGPAYFATVFGTAVPYNLALALRFDVAIRILHMPAWALFLGFVVLFGAVGDWPSGR